MESRTPERAPSADRAPSPEAIEFVRFCHRRRSVGWPELYDEMCAVAGRGLFRGWSADELGAHGIGFSLFEMPHLAVLVREVVAEDAERRRVSAPAVRAVPAARAASPAAHPSAPLATRSDLDADPAHDDIAVPGSTHEFAAAVV